MSRITLRMMAELPDEASALRFESIVQAKIAAFGRIQQSHTKRYWKIPEWFEVNLCLQPSTDPAAAYDGILLSLGDGWARHDFPGDYQWAIWDPNPDGKFFSSSVRWANVERFPESWMDSP